MTPMMLALCLAVAPPVPSAAEKQSVLAALEQAMDEVEYDEAREIALIALSRADLTDDERFRVHMRAGVAQRILDRNMEAQMHFQSALRLRPDAELPAETSPKIRTFFQIVKAEGQTATPDEAPIGGVSEEPPMDAAVLDAPPPEPPGDIITPAEAARPVPVAPGEKPKGGEQTPTPWVAYSLFGGAALLGVLAVASAACAGVLYILILPTRSDPGLKNIARYGFFSAVGGASLAVIFTAVAGVAGVSALVLE